MQFLYFVLAAAGIVAADQISKYFTLVHIALGEKVPFIPGLIRLTYVRNPGAAFSSFEGQQWLFALVSWSLRACWSGSISEVPCLFPNLNAGA